MGTGFIRFILPIPKDPEYSLRQEFWKYFYFGFYRYFRKLSMKFLTHIIT